MKNQFEKKQVREVQSQDDRVRIRVPGGYLGMREGPFQELLRVVKLALVLLAVFGVVMLGLYATGKWSPSDLRLPTTRPHVTVHDGGG